MPVFGTRKELTLGSSVESDPIRPYAESFASVANNLLHEGFNYFRDPVTSFVQPSSKESLKRFFLKESFDADDPDMTPAKVRDHTDDMEALFENTIEAVNENTPIGSFNPIQGITMPIYKNILMNMAYDKGAIPKAVAATPAFTRTMEKRVLVDPNGNEIDMYKEQSKMTEAMRSVNPFVKVDMDISSGGGEFKDIVKNNLNGSERYDNIDVDSHFSAITYTNEYAKGQVKPDGTTVTDENGESVDVVLRTDLRFTPGYGDQADRQLTRSINIPVHDKSTDQTVTKQVIVFARMSKDVITITAMPIGIIKKIEFSAKLDASNARLNVCSVKWGQLTDYVQIGTSAPISTNISPEEIKDISALYKTNQLTKIMSLTKTALANYKDDDIKNELDISFESLPDSDKYVGRYDFAPREGYMLDHLTYRKEVFWDFFETQITRLLQVLNDANMTVSIFGDPDLVRKIVPTSIDYTTPSNIGPVELDYTRSVFTSNKRHYSFIGSDKLRGSDEFTIILCPRGSDRITYIIYDYQMYISNEIRQNNNPALPALHAFQRYKFSSYQPVQGRLQILNPSGTRPAETENVPFYTYTQTNRITK